MVILKIASRIDGIRLTALSLPAVWPIHGFQESDRATGFWLFLYRTRTVTYDQLDVDNTDFIVVGLSV